MNTSPRQSLFSNVFFGALLLTGIIGTSTEVFAEPPPSTKELPEGHPPVTTPNAQAPSASKLKEAAVAAMHVGQLMQRGSSLASPKPSEDLPPHTIRVQLSSSSKESVENLEVQLGLMQRDGSRSTQIAQTNAQGIALFENLTTGASVSYRVRAPYQGATYLSTPFRLEGEQGIEVQVEALETTDNPKSLLQVRGSTAFEFRENRLHVVQQSDLMNMGSKTFVFPKEGMQIDLPEDFKAFQSERVMSDQKLIANESGFRIYGSLPPGQVSLLWGFDLPLTSGDSEVKFAWPFRTYMYRVIAQGAPGFGIEVPDFGKTSYHDQGDSPMWIAQSQWRPSDEQPKSLKVQLSGVPGPGPWRWIAVLGSLVVLFIGGAFVLRRPKAQTEEAPTSIETQKQALLEEAKAIELAAQKGDIGPEYKKKQLQKITDELALLLNNDQKNHLSAE